MEHVVIIGNGISGITAARHIRKKNNQPITVISSETEYFYSRTALMYIYMGHMHYKDTKPYEDWFWKKNNINLVHDQVEKVDTSSQKLSLKQSGEIKYDILIISTGSLPNKLGWPGQDLNGVQGMYHIQDIERLEKQTDRIRNAVIVGGGLIGIELAEMLLTRDKHVCMLVREKSFWNRVLPPEESSLVNRIIREHHVDLRLETELDEIIGDASGHVNAVRTKNNEEISCEFVGLTVGVSPNISFLKNSDIETDRGILVDEYLQTNITNVYAIGDCVQHRTPPENRRPVEQVWYTGRIMGETVAETIVGQKMKYKPGPWFNSAKFFNVEYQTYGIVPAELKEGDGSIYEENADEKKCIRLVYDKNTRQLKGVNSLGIRLRHDVIDYWLRNGTPMEKVLKELDKALFDPEFFKNSIKELFKNKHYV